MSQEALMGAKRKHVVIVGAGASGMACAATLANHPDKFQVTVLERMSVCGGQATSISIDGGKYGASWMNDGVQGGSGAFKHTSNFFRKYGHDWEKVKLQISFGKGKQGFWTNVFPSHLVEEFSADIKKFGKVLQIIKYTTPILGLVPIRIMLRLFFFSKDFGDKMVYPLMALFLGTGNQTANVACAILERLFNDPNMKLWNYDSQTLLPNLPEMCTFPKLAEFYADWKTDLESRGVNIRLNTAVTGIQRRDATHGIELTTQPFDPAITDPHADPAETQKPDRTPPPTTTETYDTLVLCTLADTSLSLLGSTATRMERLVLCGAKFYDDVTITHTDSAYMNKIYETTFKADLAAEPRSQHQKEQLAFAKGEAAAEGTDAETDINATSDSEPRGFRPMYYTHTYDSDPRKIEMSFDVSNYQHQFTSPSPSSSSNNTNSTSAHPHVYQTIFLDRNYQHLWTRAAIDPASILKVKWWHQLGHRWQHYVRVVPGLMWINNCGPRPPSSPSSSFPSSTSNTSASTNTTTSTPTPSPPSSKTRRGETLFAGSWTLVNMHEVAVVSGIAAAWRLGAAYEVFDGFAETFFRNYVALAHGVVYWRRWGKENRKKKGV